MTWRNLLGRPQRDDRDGEILREMDFHLAERIDDLVARGMSPEMARAEARRRLGDPVSHAVTARPAAPGALARSIASDVRYALRMLRSSPGFAAVAIASIALGIGANATIFSVLDALVLRPLPVPHPEQLVRLTMGSQHTTFTNPLWEELRDARTPLVGAFAFSYLGADLSTSGERRPIQGNWVSGSYFNTLGVRAAAGRVLVDGDDRRGCPAIAVLSYPFWQSEYGGANDAVGRTIALDGRRFTIVGVAQRGFSGLQVGSPARIFAPLCAIDAPDAKYGMLGQRRTWFLTVAARLRPGMTIAQLRGALAPLAPAVRTAALPPKASASEVRDARAATFDVLPAASGFSYVRTQYRASLTVLMAMVGLLLLVGCVNVANLLLARSAARQREVAIRVAIGAGRGRVARQFLTESLVLSLTGAVVGLAAAFWASHLLVGLIGTRDVTVTLDLGPNLRVLGFTGALAVATAVLFGVVPAWRASRMAPSGVLVGGRGVTGGRSRLRVGRFLVTAQVALSLVLVIGAGLLLDTFHSLTSVNPGFDRDHVLLVDVSLDKMHLPAAALRGAFDDILTRFRAAPGVAGAGLVNFTPVSGGFQTYAIRQADARVFPGDGETQETNSVADHTFGAMGMTLLAGRDFNGGDVPASPKVAIVSAAAARKLFGVENALGHSLRTVVGDTASDPITVVGVVGDIYENALRDGPTPLVYFSMRQEPHAFSDLTVAVRVNGPPLAAIPAITRAALDYDGAVTLDYTPLAAQVASSLVRERLLAAVSTVFGLIALGLAMIGLYGVTAYGVAQRRAEIGIRMALGAPASDVFRMVVAEVGRVVALGVIIGSATALAAGRLVEAMLYGTTPRDPSVIGGAIAAMVVVAMTAAAIPARRASRVDPIEALRQN